MSQDQGAESSAAFRAYLQHFGLSRLEVARAARVRLMTVWKVEQGLPIRAEDALAVCAGLHHLTGVSYSTLIPVIPAEVLWMTQAAQAGRKS
ncbi:MAG TPA: hypothetical protein VFQ30_13805 [Ktedonobacteraceae bacterium]|nr:hypothetical protein [Ktedonobacteraceae bacterium]